MQPTNPDDRPGPPTHLARPFRLSDAVILVAVLAAALGWVRGRWRDSARWISDVAPMRGPLGPGGRSAIAAANGVECLPPLLAAASAGVLVLRLRRPRPPLRLILRQPGAVASAVGCLVILPATAAIVATKYSAARGLRASWALTERELQPENLLGLGTVTGLGVLAAWIGLLASKRWRPEPSWIDRLGRLLGLGWILLIFGGMILPLLQLARIVL